MTKKERFNKVFPILEQKFQKPITALNYKTPYQLLIAVILSAQCTDVRVNIVTKELFKIVKGPKDLAEMSLKEIEKHIRSTGFYKNMPTASRPYWFKKRIFLMRANKSPGPMT